MKRAAVLLALAVAAAFPCLAQEEPGASLASLRLDDAFGTHGEVRGAGRGPVRIEQFTHVAFDSRGRIVVAGERTRGQEGVVVDAFIVSSVARFLPDGSPDTSFGTRGVARLPLGGPVTALVVDGRDRIAVVGAFGRRRASVGAFRLTAAGRPDRSFSRNGRVEMTLATGSRWQLAAAVPADDGLVVAAPLGTLQHVLLRIDGSGDLAADFGVRGVANVGPDEIRDVAVDASGRFVVSTAAGVLRLRANGQRDLSFGTAGTLRGPGGTPLVGWPGTLALDAEGRITLRDDAGVVSGERLFRWLAEGAPDLGFAGDGGLDTFSSVRPSLARSNAPRFASGGGRCVVAAGSWSTDNETGQFFDPGIVVESISLSAPGALAWLRVPDVWVPGILLEEATQVRATAVAPDGSAVFVAGASRVDDKDAPWPTKWVPRLLRVELTPGEPTLLPDLRIGWDEQPSVHPAGVGNAHPYVAGVVHVTNAGDMTSTSFHVSYHLSDDATLDPAADPLLGETHIPGLRSGETFPATVHLPVPAGAAALHGRRVIAVVTAAGFDADPANDVAVSAPVE